MRCKLGRADAYYLEVLARLVVIVVLLASLPNVAAADDAVVLAARGMQAYEDANLDGARELMESAITAAQREGLHGRPLADIHLQAGVVFAGDDAARGRDQFVLALRADSTALLDRRFASPAVSAIFDEARALVALGQGGTDDPPPERRFPGNMPHEPVPEQLAHHAVPVYVEVPRSVSANVRRIVLFYRARGMERYERRELVAIGNGYGLEIPCADVEMPTLDYYLVAYDPQGDVYGYAGTDEEPIRIPIVSERTHSAPSLPGRLPPRACSEPRECPPGMPCAEDELVCHTRSDCELGDECVDGRCMAPGEEPLEQETGDSAAPRFFAHLGFTVGAALMTPGMTADTLPPNEGSMSWVADNGGTDMERPCDPDHDMTTLPSGDARTQACVYVKGAGFVPTLALRLTAGYYLLDRLAVALTLRFQPSSGAGSLSHYLVGARVQYLVTDPVEEGFSVAPFLGTGFGQVRPQVDRNGPHALSGRNSVSLGSVVGYRFAPNVGVVVAPEAMLLFPNVMFNVDVTASLEIAF